MRLFWSIMLFLTTTFFTICLTIGILQIGFGSLPTEIFPNADNNYWDPNQYYFGLSSIMTFLSNYSRSNDNLRTLIFIQPFNDNYTLLLSRFEDIQSEFNLLLNFDFSGESFINLIYLLNDIVSFASYNVWCALTFMVCLPTYLVLSFANFFKMLFELLSGAYNQPMYPRGLEPIFNTLQFYFK